jgi:hypothetical protein
MKSPIPAYSADNERLEQLLHILVENGFGLYSWEKPAVQKALLLGGLGSILAERLLKIVRQEFTRQELVEFRDKISPCFLTQGPLERGDYYEVLPDYFAPHVKGVIGMLVEMLDRRE